LSFFQSQSFNLFATMFLSIILEAIPFLLLGTFLSSIIEIFIPEEFFQKYIPKNKFLALLMASFIGLIFPVCECAVIPVAARLLKKKVPLYFAITFILAVPIINIPVMLSTYYAFSTHIHIFLLRIFLGFIIAYSIGLIISAYKKEALIENINRISDSCECNHCHGNDDDCKKDGLKVVTEKHFSFKQLSDKISIISTHTIEEFFETGKYLLFGAIIASLFQSTIPRSALVGITTNSLYSSVIMIFLSYILSICSQTDAFIARSFLGQFPQGAIIGFMVTGAMIDIKNTFMLSRVFKKEFFLRLIILIILLGLISSIVLNEILGV
jgi:uncharacterized protein